LGEKHYIGSKIAEIASDILGPCLFIGDFGLKCYIGLDVPNHCG